MLFYYLYFALKYWQLRYNHSFGAQKKNTTKTQITIYHKATNEPIDIGLYWTWCFWKQ